MNSSLTRVVPVFDHLRAADPTGAAWLPGLLHLPVGGSPLMLTPGCRFKVREWGWGRTEKPLEPPAALLSWLIRHPRPPNSGEISADPAKAAKRQEWIGGSGARIREGVSRLRGSPSRQDWHVFEGPSYPDVYLETEDLVVVIEGKRTEREPTTVTKWMSGRHQMLRHIDCAWEERGTKQVIGFFIVESRRASGDIPSSWFEFAQHTISPEAISSSLPHRGPEEQAAIKSCFIGVTTWQRVCREFHIPRSLLR